MTDSPPTITSILSFLEGNAVEPYGNADTARRVLPILESCMKQAVHEERDASELGDFLSRVYWSFLFLGDRGLRDISLTFKAAWRSHYFYWVESNTDQLKTNPNRLGSTTNIKLPSPNDTGEIARAALDEIGSTLLQRYIISLRALASAEKDAAVSKFASFDQGRQQEDISTIHGSEWYSAWTTEFHGDVLKRLELKLHLNCEAVTSDNGKMSMSRIIPVVQASGTGKSRLAEEYAPFL